jgi:hypothetical protein
MLASPRYFRCTRSASKSDVTTATATRCKCVLSGRPPADTDPPTASSPSSKPCDYADLNSPLTSRDQDIHPAHRHNAGCSVKQVQAALGHKSAKVTLDVYGDLWPREEDRVRDAIGRVFRPDALRGAHG